MSPPPSPLIDRLQNLYLIYTGVLPAAATFAILLRFGTRAPLIVLVGGLTGVSVYLAALYSYTQLPSHPLPLIILLLDGPLFALLSLRNNFSPFGLAIESYLIDGTAVWIAILLLALVSPLPTPGQRAGSVAFMLAALGVTSALFWPYIEAHILGDWQRTAFLLTGLVEATLTAFPRIRQDQVLRGGEESTRYLVALILLWSVAMIAGSALHDAGVQLWRL